MAAGARDRLRRVIYDMLERFCETTNPTTASSVPGTACWRRHAVADCEDPVRLADHAEELFCRPEAVRTEYTRLRPLPRRTVRRRNPSAGGSN